MALHGGVHALLAEHDDGVTPHRFHVAGLARQVIHVHLGARWHRLGARLVCVVDAAQLRETVVADAQHDRPIGLGLPVVERKHGQVLPGQERPVVPFDAALAALHGPGG